MADRDYAPDEWSDHDFLVITGADGQEQLRTDLSWLPWFERIVMSFRETDHGLKVVYDDGHMLEFAVFDLEELGLAGLNRYRVLFDRGGVEERIAEIRAVPRPQRDDEHLFGMVVTAALVAGGRGRRGEVLSASFLVTWGLTYLTRLISRHVPAENASLLDEFDSLRRFERVYPELAAELAAICRLPPSEGGPALLGVLDRELRAVCPELPWAGLDAVRARFVSSHGHG
jgi:lincosamide nucleotidyltransferase